MIGIHITTVSEIAGERWQKALREARGLASGKFDEVGLKKFISSTDIHGSVKKLLNRPGFPIESWDPGGRVPALRQPPKVVLKTAPIEQQQQLKQSFSTWIPNHPKSSQIIPNHPKPLTVSAFCVSDCQCLLLRHCVWLLFLNDHCVLWGTNPTCAFRQVARA